MTDRTMVKVGATEHSLVFRTVARKRKSPRSFYVLRSDLERLEQGCSFTANDLDCFAIFQRDGSGGLVRIRFSWLWQAGVNRLEGYEETVRLPYDGLMDFAARNRQNPGSLWRALSVEDAPLPRIVFHGAENLRAALSHETVRRKLVRFLRDNFRWRWSEEIRFYNDSLPYSFFFREIRSGQPGICGGLILHGQEDMDKAYYSIHT